MFPEIDAYQKWLWRRAPHSSTARHYTSDLRRFFSWTSKTPHEITIIDVDGFIQHCSEQRHAPATINRRLHTLHAFFTFLAVYTPAAPANPVLPHRHYLPRGARLPRDMADDSLKKLFAVIQSQRDKAIFLLMLRCGLRAGEVRQLSLPDLSLTPAAGCLPKLRLHGKGGKQRTVYLSPDALAAINDWLAVRPKSSDLAVFLNRIGHRLSVSGIQSRLVEYRQTSGVTLSCHRLRHTFGRQMVEGGMPVTTIQKLLGHRQLSTTEIYLSIAATQVQQEFETAIQIVIDQLAEEG